MPGREPPDAPGRCSHSSRCRRTLIEDLAEIRRELDAALPELEELTDLGGLW